MAERIAYDDKFYEALRLDSERSASVILPLLSEIIQPTTCIDVGCGIGTWLFVAQQLWGSEVTGIDGEYVDRQKLLIAPDHFRAHDLLDPLPPVGRFDLVLSMEVIEHLPANRGAQLIDELCAAGDCIVFSGAIPNQGGTRHINEQWQSTWVNSFSKNGYRCFDIVRPFVWSDDRVAEYYRQNTFVAINESNSALIRAASERASRAPLMWDVVHPVQAERWQRRFDRPIPLRRALRLTGRSIFASIKRTTSRRKHRRPRAVRR